MTVFFRLLLYTVGTELLLPLPSALQHLVGRCIGLPAQHLVGFVYIAPNLFDVSLAAGCIFPVHLDASSLLKAFNHLQRRESLTRSDVEYLNGIGVRIVEYTLHSLYVSLGQINDIDIVADTGLIRCVVVVSENLQLLTDTHRCLGNKRNQIHGHTIAG